MAAHNELGLLGENIAAKRLASKGYEILERQWHCKHKEIDIIARKDNILAIVEVKTPHGRLIDADELPIEDLESNGWINAFGVAIEDLENAQIVIEAGIREGTAG